MKEFLSRKGVPFNERDVSRDQTAAEDSYRASGQMGIPVILIDNEVVVGFDRPRLEELLANVKAAPTKRPFGLRVGDAAKTAPKVSGVPVFGAYVDRVASGSAAERAGLRSGDIVTSIDDRSVGGAADLERALANAPARSRITIAFLRGDQRLRTDVTV